MSELKHTNESIKHLRENQRQLDIDGCTVGVSRQALEEVLDYAEATPDLIKSLQEMIDNWDGITPPESWNFVGRARAAIARATRKETADV